MYLNKLPKLKYTFNDTEYDLADIFRRVSFRQATLDNSNIFFTYYVTDDDTPETIARNFYKDANLWWLVLLPNNIISNNEFPISENYLTSYIDTKYPGKILFFSEYIPNLKVGNIIAGVTLNASSTEIENTSEENYAVVAEYNKLFRYALVNQINGSLEANDIVGFYDKESNIVKHDYIDSDGGSIKTKSWATIKLIKNNVDSPVEFLNAFSNYISPYYVNSLNEANSTCIGTYSGGIDDTNTINNTSLYKFMTNVDDSNVSFIITNKSKTIRDNEKYRNIKLLNPKFALRVITEIISLVNSNSRSINITVTT